MRVLPSPGGRFRRSLLASPPRHVVPLHQGGRCALVRHFADGLGVALVRWDAIPGRCSSSGAFSRPREARLGEEGEAQMVTAPF